MLHSYNENITRCHNILLPASEDRNVKSIVYFPKILQCADDRFIALFCTISFYADKPLQRNIYLIFSSITRY